MKTFFYADKYTIDTLVEMFELIPVSTVQDSSLVILSASGDISPKFLDCPPAKYEGHYDIEEDYIIRALYFQARMKKVPVIAFGRCAAMVHIFNGGRCWHKVDNHWARSHELHWYSRKDQKFSKVNYPSVRSNHKHSIDITNMSLGFAFNLVAAASVSSTKIKYFPTTLTDRRFAPLRPINYYTCEPEIYYWVNENMRSLCFEFLLDSQNIELVSEAITTYGAIIWPD